MLLVRVKYQECGRCLDALSVYRPHQIDAARRWANDERRAPAIYGPTTWYLVPEGYEAIWPMPAEWRCSAPGQEEWDAAQAEDAAQAAAVERAKEVSVE
jgi:hypothetical protein